MGLFLNFAYFLFLIAVSPVILYRVLILGKYRHGFMEKWLGRGSIPVLPRSEGTSEHRRLWFHAVSVGEINLLKPIISHIRQAHPGWEIVVSSTSQTGFELGKKLFPDHNVFYCPLDFTWSVRSAIRRIKPDWLVLVELELWPNLILRSKREGVQVAIINGRISRQSFRRYRMTGPLVRMILNKIDVIAAQDEEAAELFRRLGAQRVEMTGAIKFDGAQTDRNNAKTLALARLARIEPDDIVFLAGSTQDPEESAALETWRELVRNDPRLRLILVPRHQERFNTVAKMLESSGVCWCRRSKMSEASNVKFPVILVDTIGELGAWWGTAHIAFVGGSFGTRGGQNMLEPAAYGAAVCFGPNTKNFRDISTRMLREDAARVVCNQAEMTDFVRKCLETQEWRNALGERAVRLVLSQRGATQRTVDLLLR